MTLRRACRLDIDTVRHVDRTRRGFSIAEVSLAFVLLAIALALTAPRLMTASEASSAREAQASLELVATAAVDHYFLSGQPPTSAALESATPRLALLAPAVSSTSPTMVSVGSQDATAILAASDAAGYCWVIIRHLVPLASVTSDEVKLVVADTGCSATAMLGYAALDPPSELGTSWSSPWAP